jgi:hypothetical protein
MNGSEDLMGCHKDEAGARSQVEALSPQENAVSPDPRTAPPENAGEGDSSLAVLDISSLTEDELIAELARRAMASVGTKIEQALAIDDQEEIVLDVAEDGTYETEGFAVVATGKPGLPIADREHPWDASSADVRVSK